MLKIGVQSPIFPNFRLFWHCSGVGGLTNCDAFLNKDAVEGDGRLPRREAMTETTSPVINVTDRAAQRIRELTAQPDHKDMMLRLAVSGGGCSGFSYGFSFDDEQRADDHAFGTGDVTLLVDDVSLGLLGGAEVDFVEEMAGSAFVVRNPNATSSCGCGNSFSVG
jgi:iron-sulfur cluster insertion protein